MSRLFPKSLFGQSLLILLTGLLVSHAVGSWIYTADRTQAVRAIGGFAAAQRIANLTRLVQEAPGEWRERIVKALSDQTLQVSLSEQAPDFKTQSEGDEISRAVKKFLAEQLLGESASALRVAVSGSVNPQFDNRYPGWRGPMKGHGPMMHGLGNFQDLRVAIPLADGQWLTFVTILPEAGPAFSRQFLVSMAIMAVITLGVSIWVVRRVTAPLASLAIAAERLGKNMKAPPLPENGTIETRQASRAFNEMQTRLQNLIDNRMRMLAAISHDLRTPLTLLRLRAENIEDGQERERLLATISDMDSMVGATLQFARDEAVGEPERLIDLAALLQSIVDDMNDAGLPVTIEPAAPVVYGCRPVALKRAVTNLIDNAVKYGKSAHALLNVTPEQIEITIDDEGPGVPKSELKRMFEPFYRVEPSRSRETGGVGLGLAIAQSIAQAHGGELSLNNRPGGGLRASVILPR